MPRGDGTGPMGMGPMTGRAAGYCAGYSTPGYANPIIGRGFGFGRGWTRGRGFVRGFWRYSNYPVASVRAQTLPVQPTYTKEDELADLRAEKELIERDLKAIEARIAELEKK